MPKKLTKQLIKSAIGTTCSSCTYLRIIHSRDKIVNELYSKKLAKFKKKHGKEAEVPFKKPKKKCHCNKFIPKRNDQRHCCEHELSDTFKVNMAITKLKPAFNKDKYTIFMLSIVEQAIHDLFDDEKHSASKYLQSDMIHAELCQVDPQWIREILQQCGIEIHLQTPDLKVIDEHREIEHEL